MSLISCTHTYSTAQGHLCIYEGATQVLSEYLNAHHVAKSHHRSRAWKCKCQPRFSNLHRTNIIHRSLSLTHSIITSIIRDPAHEQDIKPAPATPLLLSLEDSSIAELTTAFERSSVINIRFHRFNFWDRDDTKWRMSTGSDGVSMCKVKNLP